MRCENCRWVQGRGAVGGGKSERDGRDLPRSSRGVSALLALQELDESIFSSCACASRSAAQAAEAEGRVGELQARLEAAVRAEEVRSHKLSTSSIWHDRQ